MNAPDKYDEKMKERIAAYVAEDMTPGERKAFEALLASDEALRDEVESYRAALEDARDWLEADAPGVERVDRLEIPTLRSPVAARRGLHRLIALPSFRFALKAAAAAAIFIMGFFLGSAGRIESPSPQPPIHVAETTHVTPDAPVETEITVEETGPVFEREEDGKLIFTKENRETGARIMMVVDAGFELNRPRFQ